MDFMQLLASLAVTIGYSGEPQWICVCPPKKTAKLCPPCPCEGWPEYQLHVRSWPAPRGVPGGFKYWI